MTLTDFLLARIAEDEAGNGCNGDGEYETCFRRSERIERECEAKRRIVEWHKSWPVLAQTPPTFDQIGSDSDINTMTFRASQQMAWLTEREYRDRFGSEPPTAPVLALLALPYADHPDYDESWRP